MNYPRIIYHLWHVDDWFLVWKMMVVMMNLYDVCSLGRFDGRNGFCRRKRRRKIHFYLFNCDLILNVGFSSGILENRRRILRPMMRSRGLNEMLRLYFGRRRPIEALVFFIVWRGWWGRRGRRRRAFGQSRFSPVWRLRQMQFIDLNGSRNLWLLFDDWHDFGCGFSNELLMMMKKLFALFLLNYPGRGGRVCRRWRLPMDLNLFFRYRDRGRRRRLRLFRPFLFGLFPPLLLLLLEVRRDRNNHRSRSCRGRGGGWRWRGRTRFSLKTKELHI